MVNASLAAALISLIGQSLYRHDRMPFEHSAIAVFLVGFVILGGLFAIAAFNEWRARRRAAALRHAIEGNIGPVGPGECVLKGTIETDDPDGRAVAIELLQRLKTSISRSGFYHKWVEAARRVDARPFYLRLEDGRAVRVEPDQRTFVVNTLDGTQRTGPKERIRSAEVRNGDHVFVIGTLVEGYDPRAQVEGGYRGAKGQSLVLRARPGHAMLISTEVPTERYVRREGFHGIWALVFALAMLLVNGLAFGKFLLLATTGTHVMATVTERTREYHRSKNGGYYSYHITARYENISGHMVTVKDEISLEAFSSYETMPGARVPFVVSTASSRIAQVGTEPGVSIGVVLFSLSVSLFLAWAYAETARRTRPWYEQKYVVERYEEDPSV
jgi:hypothetical protein